MSYSGGPRWYVVQTQISAEAKAAHNLVRQGFEIYLPRYLKRRRHARKVDFVAAPLFPRYMFVQIDFEVQRWRSIQSTFGVSHFITNGEDPAVVPTGVIGSLRVREDGNGFVKLDHRPTFVTGDKVQVLSGPFMGSFGFFEELDDRDRVAILLELLGRKVRVMLDVDLVASA